MIAIINTGKRDANGLSHYRLQINDKLIAEFTHKQSDGLGECLRRAGQAADSQHRAEVEQFLKAAAELWRSIDTPDNTDKEFNYGVQGS